MCKPLKFRLERQLPTKTLVLNFIHLTSLWILYSGPKGPEDELNIPAIIWIKPPRFMQTLWMHLRLMCFRGNVEWFFISLLCSETLYSVKILSEKFYIYTWLVGPFVETRTGDTLWFQRVSSDDFFEELVSSSIFARATSRARTQCQIPFEAFKRYFN